LKEQLRKARVLKGDSQLGEDLILRFQKLKPRQSLLGQYLSRSQQALGRLREALRTGDAADAISGCDEFSSRLWRLLLVARHKVGVQKTKHEIRAARSSLDEDTFGQYLSSLRLGGITKDDARRILQSAHQLISIVLQRIGIHAKIIGSGEFE